MEIERFLLAVRHLYYTYTALSLFILSGVLVFIFVKPKAAAKTLGGVAALLLLLYCFSVLGRSSSIGMSNKDRMINQTLGKNK